MYKLFTRVTLAFFLPQITFACVTAKSIILQSYFYIDLFYFILITFPAIYGVVIFVTLVKKSNRLRGWKYVVKNALIRTIALSLVLLLSIITYFLVGYFRETSYQNTPTGTLPTSGYIYPMDC